MPNSEVLSVRGLNVQNCVTSICDITVPHTSIVTFFAPMRANNGFIIGGAAMAAFSHSHRHRLPNRECDDRAMEPRASVATQCYFVSLLASPQNEIAIPDV